MPHAITIGNFDGVHHGHRALLAAARDLAGHKGAVTVLSFDPHPASVLRPGTEPAAIEPWDVRVDRLRAAGATGVVRLSPTPDLLAMSPDAFIGWLLDTHRPDAIVEGPDFRFGKDRAGDLPALRALCEPRGVRVVAVDPVVVTLRDQSEVVASSSLARWLLRHGRVRDAAFVLGRPHELVGTVVPGDRLGRTIGFPTANLDTASLVPQAGIYAGIADLPAGPPAVGAIHVGPRPAIGDDTPRVEAHLLNPDGAAWTPPPGMPESGWACTLRLIGRVRDVLPFDGLEPLKAQIARDCARAIEIVAPTLASANRETAPA